MNVDKELTLNQYLNQYASKDLVKDETFIPRMCKLLAGTLGEADCEGACSGTSCEGEPDPAVQMCESNPGSTSFNKSQLDWAYHQLASR